MFVVEVNGSERQASAERPLGDWLADWRLDRCRPFVVAVNDAHVPGARLQDTRLAPGDRVEVLTVSQGG